MSGVIKVAASWISQRSLLVVRATLCPDTSRGIRPIQGRHVSPEWVVLVKLYAMKVLWLYRYEHGGGPQRVDYDQ